MSIIEKLTKAIADRDANLVNEVVHDDYKFLLHTQINLYVKSNFCIKKLKMA